MKQKDAIQAALAATSLAVANIAIGCIGSSDMQAGRVYFMLAFFCSIPALAAALWSGKE